jgi:HprK-related kinase A
VNTAAALAGDGVRLVVGPFQVRVRSDLAPVAEHIDRFYTEFPRAVDSGSHFDVSVVGTSGWRRWLRPQANLVMNGERPFLPVPAAIGGGLLEWGMNFCIGNLAHQWLSLHSAVVARDDLAAIITAPSGAGKSTLCAAMVVDGWRLFSDEFGLIDTVTGELVPSPRPICLKNDSIEIIGRRSAEVRFGPEGIDVEKARFVHMVTPAESVRRAAERARPAWIIVPRYARGRKTTFEPVDKATALFHLADQSFNYNYLGAMAFHRLAALVDRCRCYALEYSDLDDVLGRLRELPVPDSDFVAPAADARSGVGRG